ncbi:hypothetical protein DC28_09450 [Spirochaeta lutea]|uniref:Uncharacterized protein n=2 Tax=Spirochaeta lutea TaxID=1480694 RepID=A0A098QX54_9SPIO|nr:hypothetical protein DC28_09450 [Spirochaeta lutea]
MCYTHFSDDRPVPAPKRGFFLMYLFLPVILFLAAPLNLTGEEIYHPEYQWAAHPPTTWSLFDNSQGITSFADQEGHAIFQVYTFRAGSYQEPSQLATQVSRGLSAQIEQDGFDYLLPGFFQGDSNASASATAAVMPGVFADLQWSSGSLTMRGYGVFLAGGADRPSYAVLAFSLGDEYDSYHDFLLSILDSFAPALEDTRYYHHSPGPVSQYFASPGLLVSAYADGTARDQATELLARAEATQVVIEREARILSQYQEAPSDLQQDAWRRFYQMIYRDSFADLAGEADFLRRDFSWDLSALDSWPAHLLDWIQNFEYRRSGTLADFEAPQQALVDWAGDCDTLVLTYLGLLEHLGVPGIVMVSPVHAHSLAGLGGGVTSPNPAGRARFSFEGQNWLVAEVTQSIDLGMLDASMADPADWMGFSLMFRE